MSTWSSTPGLYVVAMAFVASLAQAAAPYAQTAGTFVAQKSIHAARLYAIKYGPPFAAAKTQAAGLFLVAAEESRKFKRDEAIKNEYALTEEEYENLELEHTDGEKRKIRVCYMKIRGSRDGIVGKGLAATGVESPIGVFSHWCLEVCRDYA